MSSSTLSDINKITKINEINTDSNSENDNLSVDDVLFKKEDLQNPQFNIERCNKILEYRKLRCGSRYFSQVPIMTTFERIDWIQSELKSQQYISKRLWEILSDEDKLRLIHNADPRYLSDKERKLLRGEK